MRPSREAKEKYLCMGIIVSWINRGILSATNLVSFLIVTEGSSGYGQTKTKLIFSHCAMNPYASLTFSNKVEPVAPMIKVKDGRLRCRIGLANDVFRVQIMATSDSGLVENNLGYWWCPAEK
jgi:hypothetical protein